MGMVSVVAIVFFNIYDVVILFILELIFSIISIIIFAVIATPRTQIERHDIILNDIIIINNDNAKRKRLLTLVSAKR